MAVKVEAAIFNIIAFFCVVAAVVYGVWAKEPIGTTALVLSAGLTGLIGGFFWFVSRRIDARPQDRKDAEIADGSGELGFFSPGSYWPFAIGLSPALMGLALAFWYVWLILIAGVALLTTIGALLSESYVGQNAPQSCPGRNRRKDPSRHRGRGPSSSGFSCGCPHGRRSARRAAAPPGRPAGRGGGRTPGA